MAGRLNNHIAQNGKGDNLEKFISEELVRKGLGITDLTKEELQLLVDNPLLSVYTFADMISRRAQIGWSTHGHSAVDVNIYGTAGSEALHGNHENIEVGRFLRNYLDVDVKAITDELVEKLASLSASETIGDSWTGREPSEEDMELASNHYQPHRK